MQNVNVFSKRNRIDSRRAAIFARKNRFENRLDARNMMNIK